ncbi:MAG: ABC-type amino acid transport substrate-binding protein [Enterobacterales bacterium]|jgi:ABC-type amino acid transport substrate-binding protein
MRLLLGCLGLYLICTSTILQAAMTIKPGVLMVGVAPEAAPLLYMENGEYAGLEADYARLIANELKLKLEFINLPKTELVAAIENNKVDLIMSGLKVTPSLSNRIHFLPTYLQSSQMAIILYDNIIRLSGRGQLYRADKNIGVISNTAGEVLVENEIADGTIKKYSNVEQAFAALRNSEIHYFIHDAPTSWQLARDLNAKDLQSLYKPLSNDELAFAVSKRQPLLIQKIERLFRNWKAQGIIEMMNRGWIKAKMKVK